MAPARIPFLLAAVAGCVLCGRPAAQTLVRDINTTAPGAGSAPQSFVSSGGFVWFTADDGVHGREVWWTDGTTAALAADIRPGPQSSNPTLGYPFLGGVLVIANDGTNGQELHFVTRGNAALLEINPGALGTPFGFGAVHGAQFFITAWTPATGYELFVTEGAAVRLVQELVPGPNDGVAQYAGMTVVNGRVLFNGTDPAHGMELWASDGSAGGTVLVKDVVPGATSGLGNGVPLVGDGTHAWFMGYEPATGLELWRTDGTGAGTMLVHDLVPGTGSSQAQPVLAHDGQCYVRATTPATGLELFRTVGSSGQLALVADLTLGAGSSNPTSFRAAGDLVFFANGSIASQTMTILRTDGTPAGTFPVRTGPPLAATGIMESVGIGTRVLFQGVEGGTTGNEPWLSDGTVAGTVRLFDLVPGSAGSSASDFRVVQRHVVFAADDPVAGRELFAMPLSLTRGCIVETLQPGCPGTGGVRPELAGIGIPRFGNGSFELRLSSALPNSFAAALLSFQGVPGATGCALQVPLPATTVGRTTSTTGTASFPLPVPNTPSLLSFQVVAQAAVLDPAGGFLGAASLSNGLRVVVGDS